VINWILEVEDVEDVACTVDDMEATDLSRSRSLVQRGWCEGRGGKGTRAEMIEGQCRRRKGARVWRRRDSKIYGILWSRLYQPRGSSNTSAAANVSLLRIYYVNAFGRRVRVSDSENNSVLAGYTCLTIHTANNTVCV
jgi:hypothetical protein